LYSFLTLFPEIDVLFNFMFPSFSSSVEDCDATRIAEQSVQEAEDMVSVSENFDDLPCAIERASAVFDFAEVKMSFFSRGWCTRDSF